MDRKAHQQQPLSGSRVLDLPERASGDGTGVEAIILKTVVIPYRSVISRRRLLATIWGIIGHFRASGIASPSPE